MALFRDDMGGVWVDKGRGERVRGQDSKVPHWGTRSCPRHRVRSLTGTLWSAAHGTARPPPPAAKCPSESGMGGAAAAARRPPPRAHVHAYRRATSGRGCAGPVPPPCAAARPEKASRRAPIPPSRPTPSAAAALGAAADGTLRGASAPPSTLSVRERILGASELPKECRRRRRRRPRRRQRRRCRQRKGGGSKATAAVTSQGGAAEAAAAAPTAPAVETALVRSTSASCSCSGADVRNTTLYGQSGEADQL